MELQGTGSERSRLPMQAGLDARPSRQQLPLQQGPVPTEDGAADRVALTLLAAAKVPAEPAAEALLGGTVAPSSRPLGAAWPALEPVQGKVAEVDAHGLVRESRVAPSTLSTVEQAMALAQEATQSSAPNRGTPVPSAASAPASAALPAPPAAAQVAAVAPSAPSRPGLISRVVSSGVHALRSLGNRLLALVGRGDDTVPLRATLQEINLLGPQMKALTDDQLRAKTAEFKARLANGETLDSLTAEAFAVAREAADRVLKMKPFDVQVLGGLAMHTGAIAQMGTGEGKTLTATMPVYLNALSGKGAHVVTVNETLARRDAEQMAPLYEFLGLSTGIVTEDLGPDEKRKAYGCDITYTTNTSLGFDFLRDNMARRKEDVVCREPNFVLVDEVDEVLIDEARTPLIVSEMSDPSTREYQTFARVVSTLEPGKDYKVNLKERQTWLTDEGLSKVEKQLGVDNLYAPENLAQVHYLRSALVARNLFVKDKDYVVNDGKVDIVDEFTGRIMDGRRYNDGIHQALEAKEGVEVQAEQRTLASITYPNLFRRYAKVAGMSGTAKTEESEFINLYNLPVVVVPPNRPSQRVDAPDLVYKSYQEKFQAIANHVERMYQEGRPVLVGTRNIVMNEYLHKVLTARGIPHQVLNAKSVKENTSAENAILAQAGKSGMVTLATNMAGRGVDIKPDYINYKKLTLQAVELLQQGGRVLITVPKAEQAKDVRLWLECNEVAVADAVPTISEFAAGRTKGLFVPTSAAGTTSAAEPQVQILVDDRKPDQRAAGLPSPGPGVSVIDASAPELATGGLHVVGTERHESRRIDDQLKGRAARQGNPGSTQFFVSLDDELMRLFGGDRLKSVFDGLGVKDGQAVQDRLLGKAIEAAQKKVEDMHFEARKNTTKYDQVLNTQRDLMYADRKALVEGADVRDQLAGWTADVVNRSFETHEAHGGRVTQEVGRAIWSELANELGLPAQPEPAALGAPKVSTQALREQICAQVAEGLAASERLLGRDGFADALRDACITNLDEAWFGHLDDLQELQGGIGLVAYAEQDPWIAYQKRAFELWQDMKVDVAESVLHEALGARAPGPLLPDGFSIPAGTLEQLMKVSAAGLPAGSSPASSQPRA